MAGERVNDYAIGDSNIEAVMLTLDKVLKGFPSFSLTEYDSTTVPAIAAGSVVECNGAVYKFDTEEAISTTDPVTTATVANGTVYAVIVPGATTCTAAFTATAPTWSDSKQGYYGTGDQANYRYIAKMIKDTANYSYKTIYYWRDMMRKSYQNIDTESLIEDTTVLGAIQDFSYSFVQTFSFDVEAVLSSDLNIVYKSGSGTNPTFWGATITSITIADNVVTTLVTVYYGKSTSGETCRFNLSLNTSIVGV